MNWDFDRAVTGSLSKLLGAKIMDFLHTPKCFAQFLYFVYGLIVFVFTFYLVHTGSVCEVNPESWTQLKGSNETKF